MSEQDKDKKTKKSPRNVKNKNPIKSTEVLPGDDEVLKDTSCSENVQKSEPKLTENSPSVENVILKSTNDKKDTSKETDEINQQEDKLIEDEKEEEDVPTLSGWLASGFSSIVKSAKDTVNASGTLESIKRDLVELKATVQSTSASSVLNSTASIVKNTLNEIGATVNEISSLGTSLPDDDFDDETSEKSSQSKKEILEKKRSMEKTSSLSESNSTSGEEHSLFNFSTLNSFAHKFGESARNTLSAVKDVVVDSLALKNETAGIDELEEDAFVFHNGVMLPLPDFPSLLRQIQIDGRTFIKEPEGSPEVYEEWLSTFSLIDYEKQMEHLIATVPELASIRETLVPGQLSDNDFWHRYYYKAHLLKEKLKAEAIEKYEKNHSKDKTFTSESKGQGDIIVENSKPGSVASSVGSAAQLSRSSTDDWDKVDAARTSDDEKDWVKCD